METFKNTLGFIAAGLVLLLTIVIAQEPSTRGSWPEGYGTLAPDGQHVQIWHRDGGQMCVVSHWRYATKCIWVSASRVTMD
jgi:hypothetical protein